MKPNIGGKEKNKHAHKKTKGTQGRSTKTKTAIIGIRSREGKVKASTMERINTNTMQDYIDNHVQDNNTICTDEARFYQGVTGYAKLMVNHSVSEYVNEFTFRLNEGNCAIDTIDRINSVITNMVDNMMNLQVEDKYCHEFDFYQEGAMQLETNIAKAGFLNKLKTQEGKNKYKRYLGSPLRYAGGKSLAVGLVVDLLPSNINRLISPFMGGGAVEIACAKELKIPVIAFDIFDILANYWDVQVKQPKKLAESLKKLEPTQKEYTHIKHVLKAHWDGKIKLSKYDLAVCYYFNHNTSYGPHFLGSQSSVYLQEERYKKTIEKVANFDAPLLSVSCQSFEHSFDQYPNDFFYCDPPYYLGQETKMFVGMYPHRNFPIHHNGFKHELLRDKLLAHKGGFILSYNDCPTIRDWYKGCNMSSPKWQYTFDQGDTRIGKNRTIDNNGSHIKESHELLIWRLPNEKN